MSAEQILEKLLALNLERAGGNPPNNFQRIQEHKEWGKAGIPSGSDEQLIGTGLGLSIIS